MSAAMPTLFFLNRRQASWRGLLLVSIWACGASAATAVPIDFIHLTVVTLSVNSNELSHDIRRKGVILPLYQTPRAPSTSLEG